MKTRMSTSIQTLVALVPLIAACSGSDAAVGSSPSGESCATPASSYLLHYVEKPGGTCGALHDEIANTTVDGSFQAAAGCSGSRVVDGCTVLITNYTCTPSNDVTTTTNGELTWASDGSKGSGTVQIMATTKGRSCSSLYVVSLSRQ